MSRDIKFPLEKKPAPHGDGYEASHPGFGILEINRVTGRIDNLVGVDFPQGHAIHFTLRQARMNRAHGTTRWPADRIIADFYMSEVQFAQAITSLNSSHRNPVTLKHYCTGEMIAVGEIPPHMADLDAMKAEVKETNDEGIEALEEALRLAKEGKVKKSIVAQIEKALRELHLNHDYRMRTAAEAIDEIADKAKMEVRAFAESTVRQYGLDKLGADTGLLLDAPQTLAITPGEKA